MRVEFLIKVNGGNHDDVFLNGTGTLTITRFDGRVLAFIASGHMPFVSGNGGGASITLTGAVQVG